MNQIRARGRTCTITPETAGMGGDSGQAGCGGEVAIEDWLRHKAEGGMNTNANLGGGMACWHVRTGNCECAELIEEEYV